VTASVPTVADTVRDTGGELRAGGTDVSARHRGGIAAGPFVDLRELTELRGTTWSGTTATIGALTTVAEVAADAGLRERYPALTATAGALATPQIRRVATIGGNLLQRNRCWYFRNPRFRCHQDGGTGCPVRGGVGLYATVVGESPCLAPHPSSIAMALIGYGAVVEVQGRGALPVADLYDAADPTRDHVLAPGEVLTAVRLPEPLPGERAAYRRAISRFEAEWPLVEAVARVALDGPTITTASVAAGGVARTPLHLPEVGELLVGRTANAANLATAADAVLARCGGGPAAYKGRLLRDTVLEVLELALDGAA
jgi:xanthine dehydrogenase YagS FAD-binding subunit